MNIDDFDVEELVRGMFELSDDADVCDVVEEKFNIDWDSFVSLIAHLMPLIVIGESPLTHKLYSGFGKDNMFFIKQEIG